jgi:hypothetical protein
MSVRESELAREPDRVERVGRGHGALAVPDAVDVVSATGVGSVCDEDCLDVLERVSRDAREAASSRATRSSARRAR